MNIPRIKNSASQLSSTAENTIEGKIEMALKQDLKAMQKEFKEFKNFRSRRFNV